MRKVFNKLKALALMAGLFVAPTGQMAQNNAPQLQNAQQDKATNEVMGAIKQEMTRSGYRKLLRRSENPMRILNQRQRRKLDRQVPQRVRKRGRV